MGIVNGIPRERRQIVRQSQEPLSRSIQLHYIPVAGFSETDLFLDRISSELDSHESAGTAFLLQKKSCTKNRSVSKNAVTQA